MIVLVDSRDYSKKQKAGLQRILYHFSGSWKLHCNNFFKITTWFGKLKNVPAQLKSRMEFLSHVAMDMYIQNPTKTCKETLDLYPDNSYIQVIVIKLVLRIPMIVLCCSAMK